MSNYTYMNSDVQAPASTSDVTSLRDLKRLGYRPISNQRARTLRKRGEFVYWDIYHNTYLWESGIIQEEKTQ